MPVAPPWRILVRQPEAAILSRRRISLIARLLSLALLFGQLGAEAHAYSHLSGDSQGLPETTQLCRACLSFAPLQGVVGGSATVSISHACMAETFVRLDASPVPRSPAHPAFRSRAPPILL
ncbi:MAG: hypothetical protein ACREVI_03635 [Steroidobacteraceae bacterium]